MGMIGNVIRVSERDLLKFLNDSKLLEDKIYSEEADTADWYLDLDKSWQAIQFILTGKSLDELGEEENEPTVLTRALISMQVIDMEQNLGYGPAFFLTSEEVKETNAELQKIDIDDLKEKITSSILISRNVYPEIWEDEESIDYLFENFELLINFYKTATEKNQAIIVFIS